MTELAQFYRETVESFLKTVVCFDDKAIFSDIPSFPEMGKTATRLGDGFSQTVGQETPKDVTKPGGTETDNADVPLLDARKLTEAFAEKGMLCSVMKPHSGTEEIRNQILKLAAVADVSILDWKLNQEDSTIARDAILEIVSEDNKGGGRLRLIIIYSIGDGKIIMDELFASLKDQGFSLDAEALTLRSEHALVALFQKPETIKPTGPVVKYAELPDRAVQEFAKLTSGLLPAAALTAISEIRDQTHHILASFPASLDGALLAHRSLIADPTDAEQFLVDLMTAEIGTLLASGSANRAVKADHCKKWLQTCGLGAKEMTRFTKAVCDYAQDKIAGFEQLFKTKGSPRSQTAEKVLELLYKPNPQDLNKSKERFSILSTLNSHSGRHQAKPPRLQLGSIVKDIRPDAKYPYLLCIQPLCDSVRIKNNKDTIYPFLLLIPEKEKEEPRLDLCIPNEGKDSGALWLSVVPKPNSLLSYPFRPKSEKERYVEAVQKEGSWVFATVSNVAPELGWIADLKIGKAQSIVSELAARIHTLGIDEFEWMRLHQSRTD
jgi:hypothetical protein